MKKALALTLLASALLVACGEGLESPVSPTGATPNCPVTVNGNGNAVNCGPGSAQVVQAPAATPSPSSIPSEACRIDYVVVTGPDTIAAGDTQKFELTPWRVKADGTPEKVADSCNEPRGPKVRWTVTGAAGSVTGAAACEALPTDPKGAAVVCGFAANVKRVGAGQFGLTAVIENRGATRYIN